jgi:hypothetical protein
MSGAAFAGYVWSKTLAGAAPFASKKRSQSMLGYLRVSTLIWLSQKTQGSAGEDPLSIALSDLLRVVEATPPDSLARTGDRLSLLFRWFLGEFGDLHTFLSRSPLEQDTYLRGLEEASARATRLAGSAAIEARLALLLLRYYLECHRTRSSLPVARELAERVAALLSERSPALRP